jgi:hypothetical protein
VRTVNRRGDFASLDDLGGEIENLIDYSNASVAEPFRRTCQAKPLAVRPSGSPARSTTVYKLLLRTDITSAD